MKTTFLIPNSCTLRAKKGRRISLFYAPINLSPFQPLCPQSFHSGAEPAGIPGIYPSVCDPAGIADGH